MAAVSSTCTPEVNNKNHNILQEN